MPDDYVMATSATTSIRHYAKLVENQELVSNG